MDTVFKTKQTPVEETHIVEEKEVAAPISDDTIEVPYLDKKDFLDTYFGIGTEWHDRDAQFYPEVQKIDSYIKGKIDTGALANSQKAVKNFLAGIEKVNNLQGETRSVIKLEVLANYIEFLMKNDRLKSNLKRYA